MARAGCLLSALLAAALLVAPVSTAARPAVDVSATGAGYAKRITVRVTRNGTPVRRAVVRASGSMTAPGHMMRVAPVRLAERSPGVYVGTVRFIMLGQWVVRVDVSGASFAPVTARLAIRL